MGVYINDMKMPKNCLTCAGTDSEYGECVLDPEKRCPEDYGKRAEWCPLVPVPKHGRLIDADALKQNTYEIYDPMGIIEAVPVDVIDNAPTVIEAEEANDETS